MLFGKVKKHERTTNIYNNCNWKMSRKEKLDILLSKWISRKLMVFIVASFALFSKNIDSSDWVIVATAYISLQGVTSIVERIYSKQSNAN